jgi:hypothetical protein
MPVDAEGYYRASNLVNNTVYYAGAAQIGSLTCSCAGEPGPEA